jgi:hypothetical protein
MSAMARSMIVVVSGNSTASAATPKKPLTPPVTPTIAVDNQVAGGLCESGSSEPIAVFRHLPIAASTALESPLLARRGSICTTRLTGAPA